jgi:hypothetical protein
MGTKDCDRKLAADSTDSADFNPFHPLNPWQKNNPPSRSPLLEFYGLPMVEHVRRRALLSGARFLLKTLLTRRSSSSHTTMVAY